MRIVLLVWLYACAAGAQRTNEARVSERPPVFAREMLAAHDHMRARVGVPPLVWSEQLAALAQKWADTLIRSGAFHPRGDHRLGENMFEVVGRAGTPEEAVNTWAGEARNYDYQANSCSARCGHYEQVVWRDTKSVGCGMARDNRREVWVCNYDPLGNLNGERPY